MNRITARRFGHWKVTAALFVLLLVASIADFYSWMYWSVVALYVAQVVYAMFVNGKLPFGARRSGWRVVVSRTTDGDDRA